MLRVYLWNLEGPLVIVAAPTGIVYCNQVDGVACDSGELEGFAVPICVPPSRVFTPTWWRKHYNRRVAGDEVLWEGVCNEIDVAMQAVDPLSVIKRARVDRTTAGCEAWVPMHFDLCDFGPEGDQEIVEARHGVLTWPNSD